MRFYEIKVTNADGSLFQRWGSIGLKSQTVDPGALDIEIDIPVATYDTPAGQGAVKIYGIGLDLISQSKQFAGKNISVARGMSKGLPLANPNQQGVAIRGTIFQGFGNWTGINMSLDLIFTPAVGDNATPKNLAINWKAGTPLSQALGNALKVAFPDLLQNINIKSNLVLSHDQVGTYNSLQQLATYVDDVSKNIINQTDYNGVKIAITNGTVNVYDGSTPPSTTKKILFNDLIGQPTWLDAGTVQIHCVMRGDIQLGDTIMLPAAQNTFTAASNSQFQSSLSFNGEFLVSRVRDVGQFRNPNAENWVTVIDLVTKG